jgi:hypothetical protein
VERNHDQATTRTEEPAGVVQRALYFAEFVVHPDAKRLEAARGGVDA